MRCRRISRASRRTRSRARCCPRWPARRRRRRRSSQNSIPQTATVPLKGGPTFTPSFDGPPQFVPVAGTSLTYVTNSSVPVIQVAPGAYYAVTAGVWFSATQITGPWVIATSVPTSIYTIPPSSPIYYVTYVRIYEATPTVVYVGYTPGYLGTVVAPWGTVVYGTGYAYSPWIGSVWYPPPYTYGVAAAPIYNPYVGYTFGFAMGLATAAWMEPYWGGAYYHPAYWGGYPCCGSASANVYGHWGNAAYSGTRAWYAGGGVAGTTFSGSYSTAHRHVGQHQRRAPVQRVDGQCDARLRPHGEHGGRRFGQCRPREQLQHLHGTALDGVQRVRHRRRRQQLPAHRRARRRARKATRTRAKARRTTPRPATPTRGRRRASATTTTPTSTATSITTTAAAGSSIRPAGGQARREIRRGPIASRRRAAAAATSGVAFPAARPTGSAAAVAAAAVDSAAAVLAAAAASVAAIGSAAAVAGAGASAAAVASVVAVGVSAAAGADAASRRERGAAIQAMRRKLAVRAESCLARRRARRRARRLREPSGQSAAEPRRSRRGLSAGRAPADRRGQEKPRHSRVLRRRNARGGVLVRGARSAPAHRDRGTGRPPHSPARPRRRHHRRIGRQLHGARLRPLWRPTVRRVRAALPEA